MEENFMTEVPENTNQASGIPNAAESTPDTIIHDLDDSSRFGELEVEINTPPPLPPPVYPLTLSREECLRLSKGGPYWHGRGAEYSKDTGTDYELVEQVNADLWNDEVEQSVLSGESCPVCRGGEYREFIYRGTKTNFYFCRTDRCYCVIYKKFDRMLQKIPLRFRGLSLKTLAPCTESLLLPDIQAEEIAFLKAHYNESFTFLGPPGTSKSTYASVILRAAMRQAAKKDYGETSIWRIDGGHFLESEVAFSCATFEAKETFVHDITVDEINKAARRGLRPVVLIEEIDKRRPTDFNTDLLGRVVNSLYENKGQLIVTSNLCRQDLNDFYLKAKDKQVRVAGGALLRRLLSPEVNVRDYFNA
jgi:DNA replication protein DnaC